MIGKTVSHYRITAELGRGGMGGVYQAEDTRLRRMVALKFLPAELTSDTDGKTRFAHEAQAASSLKHHHIGTIHDIDQSDDGQLFICMDLYECGSLKERIAGSALDVDDALRLAAQVADGLSAAHEAGIVHRDIKSANILLNARGEAVIADFGLAKLSGRTQVTKSGTTVGTAAYMSPEQTQGTAVDHRSDIWSLGVVLYQMLTGRLPFQGDHDAAVAYGIVNVDPTPLSIHRADVPIDVQPIINKCLAKNPADRYQSAAELREDLVSLRGEVTSGKRTAKRTSRPSSPNRFAITAAAVILVAAAVVVYRFYPRPVQAKPAIAVVDFQDLTGGQDPALPAGITSLVNAGLIEDSPIRVISTSRLLDLRRRLFEDSTGPISRDQAIEVARQSGASVLLVGDVSSSDDEQLVIWQLVDTESGEAIGAKTVKGTDMLHCADEVLANVMPFLDQISPEKTQSNPTPVAQLSTYSPAAYEHFVTALSYLDQQRSTEAIRELEAAVDIDSSFALAYVYLSRVHYGSYAGSTTDIALGRRYADAAWRHRSLLGVKERMLLEARRLWIEAREIEAWQVYEEILERWPDDREALENYSSNLFYRWSLEKAAKVAGQGLEFYPTDQRLITLLNASYAWLGDRDNELETARKGVAYHPENPNLWDSYGLAFLRTAKPDSAEYAFQKALAIDPSFWYSQAGLAMLSYCRGDTRRAIEQTESILARPDLSQTDIRNVLSGYGHLALAQYYAELGQCGTALNTIDRAWPYAGRSDLAKYKLGYDRRHILMRAGRYRETLDYVSVMNDTLQEDRFDNAYACFRASASIALGDLQSARETLELMRDNAEIAKDDMHIAGVVIELKLAESRGSEANEAILEHKRLGGWGAEWYELRGRTHLARAYHMAGRSDEAIAELNDLINIYKGHALGHYELGKIYEDLGRVADAERAYTIFLEMWSEADEDMPQLIDARGRLAGLKRS